MWRDLGAYKRGVVLLRCFRSLATHGGAEAKHADVGADIQDDVVKRFHTNRR
jgi:hypothetical protein